MYTVYYGIKPNGEPKVGADHSYPSRAIRQNLTDYRILEQHEDLDTASIREIELQIELIGKRDCGRSYKDIVEMNKSIESRINLSNQMQGNTIWVGKTHKEETKKKIGNSRKGKEAKHPNQIEARKLHQPKLVEGSLRRITCPHCGKDANTGNYSRWHGDNCKQNPNK